MTVPVSEISEVSENALSIIYPSITYFYAVITFTYFTDFTYRASALAAAKRSLTESSTFA
jgi:hypothetical protein